MKRGKFIVFEGLDGSGQSTQVSLLKAYLEERGYTVALGKEPTPDYEAGRELREIFTGKKTATPRRIQELFAVDRAEHVSHDIVPALERGDIFISDRYVMSTLAFGYPENDMEWLKAINAKFPWPDLIICLSVRPEVSLDRIEKRGKPKELFEKLEKLSVVAANYKELSTSLPSCVVVNGEQTPEEVHADVVEKIQSILE